MLTLAEIVAMLPGARVVGDAALRIDGVSTDSRTIAPGALFVALRGERFDGHDYLADVAQRGAAAALVARVPDQHAGLPLVVVPDTLAALGALAARWRARFNLPLVAVTGSNGKTTTKEMTAAIFVAAFGADQVLATAGNLNNDIGVPLTLLRLRAHHRAAVIELGMNHPGETEGLAAMAAPTITLITNAQREHQEFMQSVEAVAREHGLAVLALPATGVAVFPADDVHATLWWSAAGKRRVIDFALRAAGGPFSPFLAAVTASVGQGSDAFETPVTLATPGGEVALTLRAAGLHNARNAAAATAAAIAADVPLAAIRAGLESFQPVKGRMQKKQCAAGAVLIDDTYNANPDSVLAAIDVLAGMPGPRTLVLGDMGEVGAAGPEFHAEVGAHAARRKIDRLLGLGTLARHAVDAAQGDGVLAMHCADIDQLIAAVHPHASAGTVLVKGSRFMRMERVVAALAPSTASAASAPPAEAAAHGQPAAPVSPAAPAQPAGKPNAEGRP